MCPAPWTDSPPPMVLEDDFTVAARPHPLSHAPADAPICGTCSTLDLPFFDPTCYTCSDILKSRETSISQILAIMRQWVPQTQLAIDNLIMEVLKRGAHPDDRDSLTDMSLIMYAVKAGASGVGSVDIACKITEYLIQQGADLSAKCRWTDMTPLHYATFFDVSPVVTSLLHHTKGADVDTPCVEYENGTPLHIAASNLALGAARVLLKFGADPEATDDLGRRPVECIPDIDNFDLVVDAQEIIEKMTRLLNEGLDTKPRFQFSSGQSISSVSKAGNTSISGRSILQAMGLKLNDTVLIGNKLGTLRFCGTTEFATGMWAGIELEHREGKNDGTVHGIRYFRCEKDYGIFVPANKVMKAGKGYRPNPPEIKRQPKVSTVNFGKVDVSHVRGRIQSAIAEIVESTNIRIGDRVIVREVIPGKSDRGVVRFIGSVDFVDDDSDWYGVELDTPIGRHDGTVQGIRYFAAGKDRGVFVTAKKIEKICHTDAQDSLEERFQDSMTISQESLDAPYSRVPKSMSVSRTQILPESSSNSMSSSVHYMPPSRPVRRSLSLRYHETRKPSRGQDDDRPASSAQGRPGSVTSLSRSTSIRRIVDPSKKDFNCGPSPHISKFKKTIDKKYLEIGQTVMVIHSKEMAVVKYIGHSDFAPGIWVGLELRNPKGKHNGEVQGRRYFQCREGHGVMVKPRTVSVHGINGQELLRPESYYPI